MKAVETIYRSFRLSLPLYSGFAKGIITVLGSSAMPR
jgi:hypothetical protein